MTRARAVQLYRDFRGVEPDKVIFEQLPAHVDAMHMGTVAGIAYDTERDGRPEKYYHAFKPWAGPSLNASADGKTLILTGGKFEVTERGIVDMPRKANPIVAIVNSRKRGEKAKKVVIPMAKAKTRTKARKAPPKKAASGSRQIIVMQPNPVAKRKRRRVQHHLPAPVRSRRKNPHSRGLGGFHMGGKGSFNPFALIVPGIMQAAGAVATDIVTTFVPVPDAWKTGPMKGIVNIGVGMGMGMLIAKFASKKLGIAFAEGALVIGGYNMLRGFVVNKLPGVQLNGYVQDGMGNWVQTPGLNGFVDVNDMNGFVDVNDMNGMEGDGDLDAYTASMVAPDQSQYSTFINR